MKLKHSITAFLCCLVTTITVAQSSKQFDQVMKVSLSSIGYIKESDALAGYYAFYLYDKADKKNDAFKLELLDNNLSSVKTLEVLQPRGTTLLESVFNGKAFMMVYHNDGDLDLTTYDKAGKKLGNKKFDDLTKMEKQRITASLQSEEGVSNATVYPLGESGFVRQTWLKNDKMGYSLEAYDNNMKPLWNIGSNVNSDLLEFVDIVYSSSKFVIGGVGKKKSMMSQKADMFAIAVDATTGKKAFEIPLKDGNSELSLINCFANEDNNTIGLVGEYYAPGDDVMKGKSQGIFVMTLDLTGKRTAFSKISWNGDVKKFAKAAAQGDSKDDDLPRIFLHSVYRTAAGGIVAIGEQYKKSASALGIAGKVMNAGGGSGSAASMKIMDMVVLELDKEYKLTNYKAFDKKRTEVGLPAGAAYASPAMMAQLVKYMGGFDYSFSSADKGRDRFFAVYQDYDRKGDDGKKNDLMLGVIKYEDGKITNDKFPVNTSSTKMWIQPAKPGFINITEYNKKKKTLTSRIEKVSYL